LGILLITWLLSALLAFLLYRAVENLAEAVAFAILLWAALAFIAYRRWL
jgi:hypothetical protein